MKLPVIQKHHISYEPERVVYVYKGEHMLLTRMQWRKRVSFGFIKALAQYIDENGYMANNLQTAHYVQQRIRGSQKKRRRKCKK